MPQFKCDILSNFQTMCTRVFFFNVQWEFLVLHFVILYNFEYYEKIYRARWIISVTATESCCYTIIGEVWKSHNSSRVSWVKKCCCGFRRCVWRVSWISFVWKKVTSIFNMWHARFSSRYALPCLILLCGFCASINHLQNVIQSVTELTQLICHDKEVVSTALIPNAINNFYTLHKLQREVSLISELLLREEIGMKNAGISWRLRIISPFCIQELLGFALVNQVLRFWTHTQISYPLFRGFLPKPSTFRLESGNTSWPMGFKNSNIFLFWIFAPKMAKVSSIDFLAGKWNDIASHAML